MRGRRLGSRRRPRQAGASRGARARALPAFLRRERGKLPKALPQDRLDERLRETCRELDQDDAHRRPDCSNGLAPAFQTRTNECAAEPLGGHGGMRREDGAVLSVNRATLSVNRAALSVNRAALSVNGAVLSVNGAVLSVNRAALSVNGAVLSADGAVLSAGGAALSRYCTARGPVAPSRRCRRRGHSARSLPYAGRAPRPGNAGGDGARSPTPKSDSESDSEVRLRVRAPAPKSDSDSDSEVRSRLPTPKLSSAP